MTTILTMTKAACFGLALAMAAPAAFVAPAEAAVGFGFSFGSPGYGPPPPRYERASRWCARPNYYWRGGYWRWDRGRYGWRGGECYRIPSRYVNRRWRDGHWDHRGRSWVWIEGTWR